MSSTKPEGSCFKQTVMRGCLRLLPAQIFPICIFISLTLFFNCSDIKFTSRKIDNTPAKEIESIYILSQYDSLKPAMKFIGEFRMREASSLNCDWDSIHNRLKSFAYENNGNILKIDEYHISGYGTQSKAGYIKGRLYYLENTADFYKEKDSVFLFILRNEKNNNVAAKNNISILVNDKNIGALSDLSYFKVPLTKGDTIKITVPGEKGQHEIHINKQKNYYLGVTRTTNSGSRGTFVGISMGSFPVSIYRRIGGTPIGPACFYDLNRIQGKLELENIIQIKNLNSNREH